MTTNLLNIPSTSKAGMQSDISKRLQEENLEVASMFSALMNQSIQTSNVVSSENETIISSDSCNPVSDVTNSYESYQYKDNKIESSELQDVSDQMQELAEEMTEVQEQVLDEVSEAYGVEKETILGLLDEMGLNALDLLNPKNLVAFIMELTGVHASEELVLDPNFLKLMNAMETMKTGLMTEYQLSEDSLNEFISQMEAVDDSENQDMMNQLLQNEELIQEGDLIHEESLIQDEDVDFVRFGSENSSKEVLMEGDLTDEKSTEVFLKKLDDFSEQFHDNQSSNNHFAGEEPKGNVLVQDLVNSSNFVETPVMTHSYSSIDPAQILEQIAQQVKIIANTDTQTMEMQLNPENLGKVFVQVSAEEGTVNAQFSVTNEIVKEALEMQFATLRESLNQAGVKVDNIEVTIASHEFEQNLEQNQKREEDDAILQEDRMSRRKNITRDSMDELSGLMTEEETLVAQIMKDNGNSVDLIA